MSTHPVTSMNLPGMKSHPEEVVTISSAAVRPYRQLMNMPMNMNMNISTICLLPIRWLRLHKATAAIAGR